MQRRAHVFVLLALVVGLMLGSGISAGAASPNDTSCRKGLTKPYSSTEMVKYTACREDKQDAALKRIEARLAAQVAPTAGGGSSASTPKPTTSPSPSPTASVKPTKGTAVLGRFFPDASTTGVPEGTRLTAYTGPCTIQSANAVIDAKTVTCDQGLRVFAKNLTIKNSKILGTVYIDYTANEGSLTITDSTIDAGEWASTGLGDAFFSATRVEVIGGSRSINCYASCTVKDSFVHGQWNDKSGKNHESGIRINTNSHLLHNTIVCDAQNFPPDAGCSAALTGYPDFDPVQGNRVEDNLISSSTGAGYCAYGGSTGGKPYSGKTRDITFKDNVFRRGPGGKCGYWGAITSFDIAAPGNVWLNNLWDDGSVLAPAN